MKDKMKSILMIVGVSAVVLFGLYFASCRNGEKLQFAKSASYESAVYSDTVVEESASFRSPKMMKATATNGINSVSGSGMLDSSINFEESGDVEATQERKIIKTGSLSFEVKNLSETEEKIAAWLEGFGGYIADTWTNRNNMNVTVKVPASSFEDAMNSTGDFGELLSRSISTEDVSENYYDLETRLETRRILQAKLESYLAGAKSISDLLEIERQLNDVTSELESMEKQFRRLSNQVDFSTISISCRLPANTTEAGFETPDFLQGLKDFGYNALQFLCNFGLGILYIILVGVPSVLLIALLYWLCFGKIGLVRKLFNKLK